MWLLKGVILLLKVAAIQREKKAFLFITFLNHFLFFFFYQKNENGVRYLPRVMLSIVSNLNANLLLRNNSASKF